MRPSKLNLMNGARTPPTTTPNVHTHNNNNNNTPVIGWRELTTKLIACVVVLITCVYFMLTSLSTLQSTNITLELPKSVHDIKNLDGTITKLREEEPVALIVFFCSLYVLKQTFAIPGSLILNILAGRVFGTIVGLLTTTLVRTKSPPRGEFRSIDSPPNSSLSCLVHNHWGKLLFYICTAIWLSPSLGLLLTFLICGQVSQHKDDLIYYLIFIRAVSFIPNWFVNISSPVVGVPLGYHIIAIFIGMAPYHYICAQAGSILSEINSASDVFDTWTLLKLTAIGCIAIIPVLYKKLRNRQ